MDTFTEQAIEQWRELRACIEAVRLTAHSSILVIRPAAAAVRVLVHRAVVRLHAARSALADSAAITPCVLHQSPIRHRRIGLSCFSASLQSS